ncbi:MAG: glycosyltransferase family 39 protein, partial [Patescibacteria group bacterium]
IASFTRLYKIDQYMTFLGDEGRDVMVVRNMIVKFRPVLLGPGTSIGNMYLGPLYYYLLAVPLVLANFSPVGPAISVALFGVATVGLLWWWSRQLVGRVPALLLSTLYSLSPTIIIYSHSSWNPNIMPFFSLLAMYGVWKVWRFGYWRWFIITMVSFAFVLNSHYLGLLLIPVIGLFVLRAPKNKSYKKYLFLGFGVWALLMSPLVFFDIRHDFMNFKNILHFFTNRQETVNLKVYKAIPNLWTIWVMILDSLIFAKNALVSFWGSLTILVSLFLVFKAKPKRDFWFIFIWLLVGLVGLGLYKQHIYDHYFGFLYPVVFLLLGYILNIYNKYLVTGVFVFLLGLNLLNNPLRYSPNVQWQRTQDMADFILKESGGRPFNLALLSKGNYDMSYRYALVLRNAPYKTLHEENTGQLFTICEYDDCKPIGNPLWEIAGFGWAQIDDSWTLPSGLKLYKLGRYVH